MLISTASHLSLLKARGEREGAVQTAGSSSTRARLTNGAVKEAGVGAQKGTYQAEVGGRIEGDRGGTASVGSVKRPPKQRRTRTLSHVGCCGVYERGEK